MDWFGFVTAGSVFASFVVAFYTYMLARETAEMVRLQREERTHRWAPAFLLQHTITYGSSTEIALTIHNVGLGRAFDVKVWVGSEYIRWVDGREERNLFTLIISNGPNPWVEIPYWPNADEVSYEKNFPGSKRFNLRFLPSIEQLKGQVSVDCQ
ncbi:hypothetical protein MHFGQ_22620 [Moorella humiferrea]|uniref:Uncharacterized protein n=1 Tax=Neomoorella humiferrea TaxID=676965 RepID=A0A2T0ALZ4_9FIRM|nr:hypothetical protein MOHU_22930 [Moorella humiferrea]